jgi:peptidoglycan L-alanyl-D-glutamate endopeptidase CwlK
MSTTPDTPILQEGDKGPAVLRLQGRLHDLGYLKSKPDGFFGTITDDAVTDFQEARKLAADGVVGPATWAAIQPPAKAMPPAAKPASQEGSAGKVDERSEKVIATLHPQLRDLARKFVLAAAEQGVTIKLISGLRTYNEQDALYAKGRTAPGPKVTNARAGYSNHNFGLAFDIGVFSGGKYLPESPLYKTVAHIGKWLGFEWGGDWTSIKDEPHYQLRPKWANGMKESAMLAELRRRTLAKIDYFA